MCSGKLWEREDAYTAVMRKPAQDEIPCINPFNCFTGDIVSWFNWEVLWDHPPFYWNCVENNDSYCLLSAMNSSKAAFVHSLQCWVSSSGGKALHHGHTSHQLLLKLQPSAVPFGLPHESSIFPFIFFLLELLNWVALGLNTYCFYFIGEKILIQGRLLDILYFPGPLPTVDLMNIHYLSRISETFLNQNTDTPECLAWFLNTTGFSQLYVTSYTCDLFDCN